MSISLADRKNQSDPFYRYRRDKVLIQNQTIINWDVLCHQLKTPEAALSSFLAKGLGCRVGPKGKLGKVAGTETVDELVQTYIEQFVLCPRCHLPELGENNVCNSCGEYMKKKKK